MLLVALIFCLDGVTGLIEPLPRFATAYQVSGYVDYISSTGHVVPALAAYFSWPGFFAMISFITGAAGVHSLLPLMTWWPVLIDLLLLIAVHAATRALRMSWRARWFAALLFCAGQLGRSGLLLAAVPQLPALSGVPGDLADLVQRAARRRRQAGRTWPAPRVPGELPSQAARRPR